MIQTDEDIQKYIEGLKGEKIIRDYFKNNNIKFFQIDLMAKIDNQWHTIEVKRQDPFEPPPFYGHGLPKWQIDMRLKFQEETGICAILYIVDKKSNIIYNQYMDLLLKGKQFQTTGAKPRIIFPLENFEILGL
jgi:hypothetical protein